MSYKEQLDNFEIYIESIGFVDNGFYYYYKKFKVYTSLKQYYYGYFNGIYWEEFEIDNLEPLRIFDRKYKLKQILN